MLIALISLFSCSKNKDTFTTKEPSIDYLALKQIFEAKNYEAQKSMYSTLNPNEKNEIWKMKYENLVASTKLSIDQVSFVKELKSLLNTDVFEKTDNLYKTTLKLREGEIKENAINLFGISGAYNLLANLTELSLAEYPPGSGDCDCSRSSDWCPSGHSCVRQGCRVIQGDCGWWWNYDCNGDCWMTG